MRTYILHVHRNVCQFCHAEERWSHLYQCDEPGKLKPTLTYTQGEPLSVLRLSPKAVGICARCAAGHQVTEAEWAAEQRKRLAPVFGGTAASAAAPSKPKTQRTLDDLL